MLPLACAGFRREFAFQRFERTGGRGDQIDCHAEFEISAKSLVIALRLLRPYVTRLSSDTNPQHNSRCFRRSSSCVGRAFSVESGTLDQMLDPAIEILGCTLAKILRRSHCRCRRDRLLPIEA